MNKKTRNLIIAGIIFILGIIIADRGNFGYGDIHIIRAYSFLLITTIISIFFTIIAFKN